MLQGGACNNFVSNCGKKMSDNIAAPKQFLALPDPAVDRVPWIHGTGVLQIFGDRTPWNEPVARRQWRDDRVTAGGVPLLHYMVELYGPWTFVADPGERVCDLTQAERQADVKCQPYAQVYLNENEKKKMQVWVRFEGDESETFKDCPQMGGGIELPCEPAPTVTPYASYTPSPTATSTPAIQIITPLTATPTP